MAKKTAAWRFANEEEYDELAAIREADLEEDGRMVAPFDTEDEFAILQDGYDWFVLGYPREEGWTELLLDVATSIPAGKTLVISFEDEICVAKLV